MRVRDGGAVLLLLDTEGMLVTGTARAHRRVLEVAVFERCGLLLDTSEHAAALTDRGIVRALLARAGRFGDDEVDWVLELARDLYPHRAWKALPGCAVEGMPHALAALRAAGHRFALCTGDLEAIARVKLEHAGLTATLDGVPGAFGEDAEDRADLPAIAAAR
ncbi:MAG TPA: haloacid dehalogenase-like hydrolase, partial [Baekduia sp.]|nr:haloacid dehalogenase-like hydrolase [Baekduia sp.]